MTNTTQDKPLYSKDKINRILSKGSKLEKFIMYLDNVHCEGRLTNKKFLTDEEITILRS